MTEGRMKTGMALRDIHLAGRRNTGLRGMLGALAICLLLLAGCAAAPAKSVDDGLYRWVDQEAAPYLVDQLARQPRLKDEPVLLVAMNGADVRPDIDELSRAVRSRLMDRLLQSPGTDLVWRPTVQPWEHHRSRGRLRCATAGNANILVGIDISPALGSHYEVSVRALDLGAGAWVTGFGKSWSGRLSRGQQQAYAERNTDEYLRGLRVLPFYAGETDLAAAYLAQNLSCLLRDRPEAEHRIYVDAAAGSDPALQNLLTLVAHNLAREQAVDITDDPERAGMVLGGSLTAIDDGLHQAWLKLQPRAADADLGRLDTDAYLYLDSPDKGIVMAPVRPGEAQAPPGRSGTALMSPLRVVPAGGEAGCPAPTRWQRDTGAAIDQGACLRLEFDLHRPARIFAFEHAVDGSLMRLEPRGCVETGANEGWLAPRRGVPIPAEPHAALHWAGRPGIQSVYTIAVTEPDIARRLAAYLDDLPSACGPGRSGRVQAEQFRDWLAQLDAFIGRHPDSIDWQAIRLRHAAPN
jgi:hypothetical protein